MGLSQSSSEEMVDVVLDIDETLVFVDFNSKQPDMLINNPQYGRAIPYCFAPGALEFLEVLLTLPNLRISFYSAGEKWRNIQLVKQVMDKVYGRLKARDAAIFKSAQWNHSPKILSRDEVDFLGSKNLLKVHRSLSLERAILIDDTKTYHTGQENNFIHLHPGLGVHNQRHTAEEKALIHNNLVYALGKVLFCIDKNKRHNVVIPYTLSELKDSEERQLLKEGSSKTVHRFQFYDLGLEEIRKLHPDFAIKTLSEEEISDKHSSL